MAAVAGGNSAQPGLLKNEQLEDLPDISQDDATKGGVAQFLRCSPFLGGWLYCIGFRVVRWLPDENHSIAGVLIAANASGARIVMPPRSMRIQSRSSHSRSCLFVLSRDMPIISPSSRCVIETL